MRSQLQYLPLVVRGTLGATLHAQQVDAPAAQVCQTCMSLLIHNLRAGALAAQTDVVGVRQRLLQRSARAQDTTYLTSTSLALQRQP